MKKAVSLIMTTTILFSLCACVSKPVSSFPTVSSALALSKEAGIYKDGFTLQVAKEKESDKIYYTLDGSKPTSNSLLYEGGIVLSDTTKTASYSLSEKSLLGFAEYKKAEKVHHATTLRLLEVDEHGNEVASKTSTYLIKSDADKYYTIPVVCLTSEPSNLFGIKGMLSNQNLGNGKKYDMAIEYFDKEDTFNLSVTAKLGGNWTRYNFPNKTFNVNLKKDVEGNKNDKIGFSIFGDQKAENGDKLSSTVRFRLHTGANDTTGAFFTDAYVQRMCEELSVSTTSYRPCIVYLNGEYWGLYGMREWYSADYFAQNYGVDKDNVIYADRTTKAFDKPYSFDIGDGDEKLAYKLIDELMTFTMTKDLSKSENYDKLCSMVDMESLADLVLIHEYVGNWDFMYNNLRMWRTINKEEGNPYGDTRWRFCLQDADFSFENEWADFGLPSRYRGSHSYLDFYLGDVALEYNAYGKISRELNCFFREPFIQNANFRSLFEERSKVVKATFSPKQAKAVFNDMQSEIYPLMKDHTRRWKKDNYSRSTWEEVCSWRKTCIDRRVNTFDEDITNTLNRYR